MHNSHWFFEVTEQMNQLVRGEDIFFYHTFISQKSGLSAEIGDAFTSFKDFDPLVLVLVLTIITAAFTEIASNTASATIFIPILAELVSVYSLSMGRNILQFPSSNFYTPHIGCCPRSESVVLDAINSNCNVVRLHVARRYSTECDRICLWTHENHRYGKSTFH